MDEISTGLDSSTTFQIVKCLQQIVHLGEATILMSLLQPAPETFDLFDDILLISEGQIVYQGPREFVVEFFESCGFVCPERKGTADFLQEVGAADRSSRSSEKVSAPCLPSAYVEWLGVAGDVEEGSRAVLGGQAETLPLCVRQRVRREVQALPRRAAPGE